MFFLWNKHPRSVFIIELISNRLHEVSRRRIEGTLDNGKAAYFDDVGSRMI